MNAVRHSAVLVGASGGIGGAIARSLAPGCKRLLLVGRDRARLDALAGELATTSAVAPLAADIATAAGRRAVADAAAAQACDLLINCAGTGELAWFAEQSDEAIENIIGTNLVAPMLVVHALLPVLATAPKATIVNVGSIFGYLGYPGCATYSASKFGLRGFTEALRRELAGSRIRVMHLAPRSTRTSLNSDAMYALNAGLGVAVDDPQVVANALLAMLASPRRERLLGFPERLFARLNQLLPQVVDQGMRRQLPHIQRQVGGRAVPGIPAEVISIDGCDQCGAKP
jgi:short-subunit dehydrogenase